MEPGEKGYKFSQLLQVFRTRQIDTCNEFVEFIPVHVQNYQFTNALLNISSISIFTISSVRLASTALRSSVLL